MKYRKIENLIIFLFISSIFGCNESSFFFRVRKNNFRFECKSRHNQQRLNIEKETTKCS